jgi:autotransporter-associated beta strand protein
VFNLNGGAVTFFSDNATTVGGSGVVDLHQGNGSTVNNAFNLNGGTLTVSAITSANSSGIRAFNFNGGTLKAPAANASFMALGTGNAAANVRNGGAIINDGGFAVTITQPLLHSAIAGDNATDGGLTKLGAGTLTLSGANTYNGNTTVGAGTLEQVQAVLATNAAVSISNAAVLQLDFTTTNQVNALVLNGVDQAPGVYNSTTTPTYIAGSGSLLVQAGPSGPAKLVGNLSGNALSLTWPAGQGWRLVSQTNSLSMGLNPNSAAWGTVPGVSDGNASITIDSTKPTVFYRLVYP